MQLVCFYMLLLSRHISIYAVLRHFGLGSFRFGKVLFPVRRSENEGITGQHTNATVVTVLILLPEMYPLDSL